jgi:hypothetical protein
MLPLAIPHLLSLIPINFMSTIRSSCQLVKAVVDWIQYLNAWRLLKFQVESSYAELHCLFTLKVHKPNVLHILII